MRKSYGAAQVVDDLHLEIEQGEMIALLGPSGCGKTTTLNMIAGFIAPDAGRIEIGGADATLLPAHRRDTAMVFQNYALFPHLDVLRNVGFGLKMRGGIAGAEIRRRACAALDLVKMSGFESRFPRQLSGGQQQRVALARAIVTEPAVLLLDEPLSNLDAKLREEMRLELRELQRKLRITTIFVTHDQEEAFAVSDRIALLHRGRVEQLGTPDEIYRRPASAVVASFIGRMNWLPGRIDAGGLFVAAAAPTAGLLRAPAFASVAPGTVGKLWFRPEEAAIGPGEHAIEGRLEAKVYLGHVTHWHVRVGDSLLLALRVAAGPEPTEGDAVTLSWRASSVGFLPDQGEPK